MMRGGPDDAGTGPNEVDRPWRSARGELMPGVLASLPVGTADVIVRVDVSARLLLYFVSSMPRWTPKTSDGHLKTGQSQ